MDTRDIAAKLRAERSLSQFVRRAWGHLEGNELVHGWHIDLMCEALERVLSGGVRRLLLLAPPRHTKSGVASVLFPAWTWTRRPGFQFVCVSHSQQLVKDLARGTRSLVDSPWYQRRWGDVATPDRDQWSIEDHALQQGGKRQASTVRSNTTGLGGDCIIVDDPISAGNVNSDAERKATINWIREELSTRLNDLESGRIVMVMQRLHPDDPASYFIDDPAWDLVQLPALYEEELSRITLEGLEDQRETEGEPLHPERADEETIEEAMRTVGSKAASSAQFQQNPVARGGELFDRGKVRMEEGDMHAPPVRVVAVDKAGTPEEEAGPSTSYTAMVQLAMDEDRITRVEDVERGRWGPGSRENRILQFCERVAQRLANRPTVGDPKRAFKVYIEQEPGSSGKDMAQATVTMLGKNGFRAEADPATGDKFDRMDPFAGAVERGEVSVKKGEDWVEAFLQELDDTAPGVPIVDQADAGARGYNRGIEELSGDGESRKTATVFGVG